MPMTIRAYLTGANARMSDDESFRRVYEDHITFFKLDGGTERLAVTDMQLHIYEFSWIGLLTELGISTDIHWFVIRLNGGESYTDVPKYMDNLLLPSTARIKAMYSTHISRKNKMKRT